MIDVSIILLPLLFIVTDNIGDNCALGDYAFVFVVVF